MQEKTQKATPRKLREARKRGEVVFSADVAASAVFVSVVVFISLTGPTAFSMLRELWGHATSGTMLSEPNERFPELLLHAGEALLWGMVSIAAVTGIAGFAGSIFQVGGVAAWQRIKPDAKRLNPGEGFKRIFSTRNLINLMKMLIKTMLLTALMFIVVRSFLNSALKVGYGHPSAVMSAGARAILITFAWAAAIYVVMAAVDYAHEHYEFMKQQRMSIDEVRREYKESEGDPINLSRRRSAYFEAVYASLDDRVRVASAVVYSASTAVALQYQGDKDLPRVVAKGEHEVAAQIRRLAADHLIPLEYDANLAGRLYDEVALNQAIPQSLYAPVATLLRWAQGSDH